MGRDLLRRDVWVGPLSDLMEAPAGFSKPAEMKLEAFPALERSREETVAASRAAGLLPGSMVQVSEVVEFVCEHRFFVCEGEVLTGSPYLLAGRTWSPGMEEDPTARSKDAACYAREAAGDLSRRGLLPPGVTLDVGLLSTGEWCVVEANPVWSSALYGSDPGIVVFALTAGIDHAGEHSTWAWSPDPLLVAKAERARLLEWRKRVG